MLETVTRFKEPKGSALDGSQSVAPVTGCEQMLNPSVFLIL
jgi:hypothetical protein